MSNLTSLQSSLALGAAVTVGAFGGYALGMWKNKKIGFQRPQRWKSYENADPLVAYTTEKSLRLLPVQEKLKTVSLNHARGMMTGAPEICQLLQNMIRAIKAKKVIEIGVFTGLSTLGFALALPEDGRVVACDVDEGYMNLGKPYWKEAGIDHKIDIRIQPAGNTLDDLIKNGEAGTYDLVFIDADKSSYDMYYEKSLQLIRKGGIIAVDNVLWSGSVLDPNSTRPGATEIRKFNDKLHKDQRIEISMLTTGDGLTLAFKK